MKKLFLLLPVLLAMFVTSCLKDSELGTIVPLGTGSDVMPIDSVHEIDTLLSFIADTNAMHDTVLVLPKGFFPPDIQGEYVFSQLHLFADNVGVNTPSDSLWFAFGGAPDTLYKPVTDTLKVGKPWIHKWLNCIDTINPQIGDTVMIGEVVYPIDSVTVIHFNDSVIYYSNGQHNMLVPCMIKGDVMEKGNEYKSKEADGMVYGKVVEKEGEFTVYFSVEYECEMSGVEFNLKRGYVIKGKINTDTKEISDAWMACVNIEIDHPSVASYKDKIFVYKINSVKKGLWVDWENVQ